jgi:hypothetical protein
MWVSNVCKFFALNETHAGIVLFILVHLNAQMVFFKVGVFVYFLDLFRVVLLEIRQKFSYIPVVVQLILPVHHPLND